MSATQSELSAIQEAAGAFRLWLNNEFLAPIRNAIPGFELDRQLQGLGQCVARLQDRGMTSPPWASAGPDALPVGKHLLLKHRMQLAREVEAKKRATHHLETRQALDRQLEPFDALLRHPEVASAQAARPPRLSEYLTLQALAQAKPTILDPRVFDEKFGMLTAPGLLTADMLVHRQSCQWRGTPLVLAFIDLDDLKRLNTAHSETTVDTIIMPNIMRAIEASVYNHGHAYRMGGDEYVALIPSADDELGLLLLHRLQRAVAELQFVGVDSRVTASIGMCVVDDNCFLTEREIIATANDAKQQAKASGKNCIATVRLPEHGKPDSHAFSISRSGMPTRP